MSTLDILGNTSEQADSIRLMLKVRGMKDGRFIDADPLIILKADNHQGSDMWDVYVSKTVYPTVTFNSYEAAVKHIHETPGTWRITKIYRTLPVGEEVTEADDEC